MPPMIRRNSSSEMTNLVETWSRNRSGIRLSLRRWHPDVLPDLAVVAAPDLYFAPVPLVVAAVMSPLGDAPRDKPRSIDPKPGTNAIFTLEASHAGWVRPDTVVLT